MRVTPACPEVSCGRAGDCPNAKLADSSVVAIRQIRTAKLRGRHNSVHLLAGSGRLAVSEDGDTTFLIAKQEALKYSLVRGCINHPKSTDSPSSRQSGSNLPSSSFDNPLATPRRVARAPLAVICFPLAYLPEVQFRALSWGRTRLPDIVVVAPLCPHSFDTSCFGKDLHVPSRFASTAVPLPRSHLCHKFQRSNETSPLPGCSRRSSCFHLRWRSMDRFHFRWNRNAPYRASRRRSFCEIFS